MGPFFGPRFFRTSSSFVCFWGDRWVKKLLTSGLYLALIIETKTDVDLASPHFNAGGISVTDTSRWASRISASSCAATCRWRSVSCSTIDSSPGAPWLGPDSAGNPHVMLQSAACLRLLDSSTSILLGQALFHRASTRRRWRQAQSRGLRLRSCDACDVGSIDATSARYETGRSLVFCRCVGTTGDKLT